MRELVKKSIVIFVSLLFLTSAVMISSAASVQKSKVKVLEESSAGTAASTKTVTLYRYGIDGSITPIQVDITLDDGEDIGEAIADKCSKLMKSDIEIQDFVKKNGSIGVLSKIWSRGRGLHFKANIRIQLIKRVKLFPLLPPYFRTAIIIPTIYCRYPKDVKAHTEITPLRDGKNATTKIVDGPHGVLAVGFIGYKGWLGHVSFLGFGLRTGFAGYTMLVSCKKL